MLSMLSVLAHIQFQEQYEVDATYSHLINEGMEVKSLVQHHAARKLQRKKEKP